MCLPIFYAFLVGLASVTKELEMGALFECAYAAGPASGPICRVIMDTLHNGCMCMLLDELMGQSFRKTLINKGGTLLHLTCVYMLLDKLMGQHFAEM